MTIRHILAAMAIAALMTGSQCIPDDDDDTSANDDDVVADDDDAADDDDIVPPEPFVVTGEVIALDRETGVELTPYQYGIRSGGIVVYALPDANNLSVIYGKDTLTGPGDYSIDMAMVGPFDVVAVADEDKNLFIDSHDTARQHAFNPLAGGVGDLEDVNVYVDLPVPTGWGDDDDAGDDDDDDDDDDTGTPCDAAFSGDVNIVDLPENEVAVTENTENLAEGPLAYMFRDGSGPWGLTLGCGAWYRSFLGYLDADANGFFEPSDPIGAADGNPYAMLDTSGIQITIPSEDPIDAPAPTPYVPLTGSVTYGAFTTGDILVFATHVTIDGYVFSQATLAAPGAFSLIAPADTDDVLIWAVLDEDGDGLFDVASDPFAAEGPLNTGTGIAGIVLDLGPAEEAVISGSVTWAGPVAAGDTLHLGVFDTPTNTGGPPTVVPVVEANVTFPYDFEFTGIPAGTYWVGGYLDVGSDNSDGADLSEDPTGQVGPVLLAPGGLADGITVELGL
jgi:hypothetical protein